MTATTLNGRPRRQLSDQLDRLDDQLQRQDSLINALAEGLNQAVADAAKAGVKEAVKEAVIALLTDADLRATLHLATTPAAEAKPNFWQRVNAQVRNATEKVKGAAMVTLRVVSSKAARVKAATSTATAPAWIAWRMRKIALVGLGIGLVVAALSYATTHGVAAAVSGIGAATTAVAIQGVLWIRRMAKKLSIA